MPRKSVRNSLLFTPEPNVNIDAQTTRTFTNTASKETLVINYMYEVLWLDDDKISHVLLKLLIGRY